MDIRGRKLLLNVTFRMTSITNLWKIEITDCFIRSQNTTAIKNIK